MWASEIADGNDPAIPITIALPASHSVRADHAGQRERGVGAAWPPLVVGNACLVGFRRVDAMKANTLAGDLDRVSVDNARLTA